MRTVYLCVDGASGSSRKEDDGLQRIVWEATECNSRIVKHSLWKSKTRKALDRYFNVLPADDRLVIVCKSQGAWRVLDYLERNHKTLQDRDIHVVSIDPHHWASSFIRRNPSAVFDTINVYQLNDWPCGYLVNGAHNVLMDRAYVDHWNIVHEPAVRAAIIRAGAK